MKFSTSPAYVVRLTAVGMTSIGEKLSNDHLLPTIPLAIVAAASPTDVVPPRINKRLPVCN